ncbi:MAG TPA: helix-turn-helix domain-containing protein [Candidatus Binataceae bacterium]|nr:helix-turn-helix domain-containing protein [Candidatus Binataceae bacterium]
MDRLVADNTRFSLSAHLPFSQSQSSPDEPIEALENALRRVSGLSHPSPVVRFARKSLTAFQRLQRTTHGHARLTTISGYVAFKLNVKSDLLFSKCRNDRVAFARAIAIYVARTITGASFPELGEHFGRNHSTCVHAYQLIAVRIKNDPAFRRTIENLERSLRQIRTGTPAATA